MFDEHAALMSRLEESSVALRATIFTFYRRCKTLNLKTPWLNVAMSLPFEAAFEHALCRPWNNVTKGKADEIQKGLGKAAAEIVMEHERSGK